MLIIQKVVTRKEYIDEAKKQDVTFHFSPIPTPPPSLSLSLSPMGGSVLDLSASLQQTPCYLSLSWPANSPAWSGFDCFSSLLLYHSALLEGFGYMASLLTLGYTFPIYLECFCSCSLLGMISPSSSPARKEANRTNDNGHNLDSYFVCLFFSNEI